MSVVARRATALTLSISLPDCSQKMLPSQSCQWLAPLSMLCSAASSCRASVTSCATGTPGQTNLHLGHPPTPDPKSEPSGSCAPRAPPEPRRLPSGEPAMVRKFERSTPSSGTSSMSATPRTSGSSSGTGASSSIAIPPSGRTATLLRICEVVMCDPISLAVTSFMVARHRLRCNTSLRAAKACADHAYYDANKANAERSASYEHQKLNLRKHTGRGRRRREASFDNMLDTRAKAAHAEAAAADAGISGLSVDSLVRDIYGAGGRTNDRIKPTDMTLTQLECGRQWHRRPQERPHQLGAARRAAQPVRARPQHRVPVSTPRPVPQDDEVTVARVAGLTPSRRRWRLGC
jgi:hypothetical protein